MTGQVKEEILCRYGELGIRVANGAVHFDPSLLRQREFIAEPRVFCYLDVDSNWQDLTVPAQALAFTWCQVPILYTLGEEASLTVVASDGSEQTRTNLDLSAAESAELFQRSGQIRQLNLTLTADMLLAE